MVQFARYLCTLIVVETIAMETAQETELSGPPERLNGWPYLLLTLAPIFWSGNVVISRAVHASITPVPLTFWRWTVALCILLPLSGRELWRQRAVLRTHWRILLVLGFLGITLYQLLAYQAIALTTALNVLLITATSPLFMALVGWIGFREAITGRVAAGIALSIVGVIVVITDGDWVALRELRFNLGDLIMVGAVLVWATYSNLLKARPRELSQAGLLTATALAGMTCTLPIFLWSTASGTRVALTWTNLLAILYIGIFASVVAYAAWNQGVSLVGATRAGLFINLMPIFGGVLAILFLGERPESAYWLGASLVFAGIFVGTLRRG